jgi:hypothetical protein
VDAIVFIYRYYTYDDSHPISTWSVGFGVGAAQNHSKKKTAINLRSETSFVGRLSNVYIHQYGPRPEEKYPNGSPVG